MYFIHLKTNTINAVHTAKDIILAKHAVEVLTEIYYFRYVFLKITISKQNLLPEEPISKEWNYLPVNKEKTNKDEK